MAKSNRPLKVLVHPDIWDHSDIVALREKGNEVDNGSENLDTSLKYYDLVLGLNVWRVVPGMEDAMIPMAIKAARKVKYGKSTHQQPVDEESL